MKLNLKPFYLIFVLLLGLTFSCQDEVIEETPANEEETLVANSNLANLMRNTVTLDGSIDNIIDNANCILVDLPVTVTVNGITITIESVEDYDAIEEIIDEFTNDQDEIEIQFPIVIILSDYTEITIENQDELEAYINDCFGENEPDDDIECIDFQYPISFSIYDSNFQVIETVTINSDQELYFFIEELEGGVLASIDFPINMVLANGEVIEVNNNTELEVAIAEAEDDCDEDDDYDHNDDDECNLSADFVENWLYECPIDAYIYDENGDIIDENQLEFGQNNEVIVNGTPAVTEVGSWTLEDTDNGVVLNIAGLNTFNLIDGDWTLTNCENNNLEFTQDTGSGIRTMVFEMDCNTNETPFDCFGNTTVTACDYDNDGFATFELETLVLGNVICDVDFTHSFHMSQTNAEANVNPIAEPNAFVNTINPQTVYLRIEALNGDFEVFTIELAVENCNSNCTEEDVDMYLQGCNWKVVNFNGDDHLIAYNIDFASNTEAIITGNGISTVMYWSSHQSAEGVVVEFSNVAAQDIQAITGSWLVVECEEGRLQFEAVNSSDTMVMECYYYTVEEMLSVLSECQWEVYSFQVNNVDQTSDYDDVLFTFYENDFALAEVGASIINYGNLEAESGNSGTELLVLLSMTGETFNLGGYYTVISMTEDEITFYDSQPRRLILRKTCANDHQDSDTTQIKDWLNDGNWEVTYSTMENVENSEDYDDIVFDFQSDATLLGDNGSWMAELDYEVLRDQEGNLRFVINYLGQFPYWQMDDDWYITEVDSTRLEVHSVNDDNNTEFVLVFEKL